VTRPVVLAAIPVALVALVAGTVSYSHIVSLGLRTGQSPADAHLLPLAVDGLIVAGSVILLAGSRLGWIGVALGVAGTLYANVMSGLPRGPLPATVAAWPALAFTAASFMLERWLKSQVSVADATAFHSEQQVADDQPLQMQQRSEWNGHAASNSWSAARPSGWS
jgi:Protein of unknown function (DUF2637)